MAKGVDLSVVIPVHNEANILADSVAGLMERIPPISSSFEIILCENGSWDRTLEKIEESKKRHPEVVFFHQEQPNYGRALREGILRARGEFVVCDEIDLCDTDFYREAMKHLRSGATDLVIGSKLAPGASDQRPWLRHFASCALNAMLRMAVGFRGTDTHGLKAFRREPVLPVVKECLLDENMFASEFVIRAQRAGLSIVELPLEVREKRKPTINLFRRVPRVLVQIGKLVWAIHIQKRQAP
jgi:glycosyltransferase involved in cell wall biosynthesis